MIYTENGYIRHYRQLPYNILFRMLYGSIISFQPEIFGQSINVTSASRRAKSWGLGWDGHWLSNQIMKSRAVTMGVSLKAFIPRQMVSKNILDTKYQEVSAWRYECAKFGCTFRVYPEGVNKQQISKRVNGMAIMLYILGLSYGAVEIVLGSLGVSIGKTSVYRAVQSASEKVPGMKQKKLLADYKTKAVGADVTSVRCNGKWIQIGISVDAVIGIAQTFHVRAGPKGKKKFSKR